jgi:hypothetical protein
MEEMEEVWEGRKGRRHRSNMWRNDGRSGGRVRRKSGRNRRMKS